MSEDGSSRGPGRPGIPSGPRKPVRPGGPNTRWPQYVQYLVVVGVTALFLLLAVSMQQHHFLTGEAENFHPADR
jgi:hypothetical protein